MSNNQDYCQRTLVSIFEEQAKQTPRHIAIQTENEALNYQTLNEQANRVARTIRKLYQDCSQEITADTLLAVSMPSSLELIVTLLGVLKAGAAYVPINPDYPADRICFFLKDTKSRFLLTVKNDFTYLNNIISNDALVMTEVICLDEAVSTIADTSNLNEVVRQPIDLANILYTSGTTGVPKGVMITQQGVIRLVKNTNYIHITPNDIIAQTASISFDAATFEIWGALLNGACLYMVSKKTLFDCNQFAELLNKKRLTILWLTSELFNQYANQNPSMFGSLSYLLVGGDVLNHAHVRSVLECNKGAPAHFLNGYGPTENTTFTTTCNITKKLLEQYTHIPIGKPISNTKVYILDEELKPVLSELEGELYTSGIGLAQGYLNQSTLTAQKFITNPFDTTSKLYRTGDLAKWLPDGNIEFIGRRDTQIKIRGFRVELQEIADVLNKAPNVRQSTVLLKEHANNKYLVAYYLAANELDEKSLLIHLRKQLPEYMLPNFFMYMTSFPITMNGKLDRQKLPEPDFTHITTEYVKPASEYEEQMCSIWQNILGIEKISVLDRFFSLGGNSILAMAIVADMTAAGLPKYSVVDLLSTGTIRGLINAGPSTEKKIDRDTGNLNALHHIEKIMLDIQIKVKNDLLFNESFLIDYTQKISFDCFQQAVNLVMDTFEILHSNYAPNEKGFLRIINKNSTIICEHFQIANQKALSALAHELVKQPFACLSDKLMRFYLIDHEDTHYSSVFIVAHHAILDATSMINTFIPTFSHYLQSMKNLCTYSAQTIHDFNTLNTLLEQHYEEHLTKNIPFWQQKMLASEPIILSNRVDESNFSSGQTIFIINSDDKKNLMAIANELNVSLYTILFSLFSLMIGHHSTAKFFAIITNIDERIYFPDFQHIFGCFINELFVFVNLSENITLQELIEQIKNSIIESIHHGIKCKHLIELDQALPRTIANIHFNLETEQKEKYNYEQSQVHANQDQCYDNLYFEADMKNDSIDFRVQYRTSEYDEQLINTLIQNYQFLIKNSPFLLKKNISHITPPEKYVT